MKEKEVIERDPSLAGYIRVDSVELLFGTKNKARIKLNQKSNII